MEPIPESNWKVFRELHKVALERCCADIVKDVGKMVAARAENEHERFLALYQLINKRNKEIARLFDDFRRSTAIFQLTAIVGAGWINDEELRRFSDKTRLRVEGILSI